MGNFRRKKTYAKTIEFYKNYFNLNPPYNILIDGTFAAVAYKSNMILMDVFSRILNESKIKMFTTSEVLHELLELGLPEAANYLKRFCKVLTLDGVFSRQQWWRIKNKVIKDGNITKNAKTDEKLTASESIIYHVANPSIGLFSQAKKAYMKAESEQQQPESEKIINEVKNILNANIDDKANEDGTVSIDSKSIKKVTIAADNVVKDTLLREKETKHDGDFYIVASKDTNLMTDLRNIARVALIYMSAAIPILEPPTPKAVAEVERLKKESYGLTINPIKVLQYGTNYKEELKKREELKKQRLKSKPKEPNPLSVKKKAKNNAVNKEKQSLVPERPQPESQIEKIKKSRRGKRGQGKNKSVIDVPMPTQNGIDKRE